jgi:polysaccharide pyruvyl transferase WcaK-like protein
MREILLAGAYGQANPGDEALLGAFLDVLDRDQVVVTSHDPAATERTWRCAAMAPTAANVVEWLDGGRHLVVGGGTIFKTLHPTTGRRPNSLLVQTLLLVRVARARGITVSFVGVGAAHLPTRRTRRLVRSIARNTDLLVMRDTESASVLAAAGVPTPLRVGADPAWTLFDAPADDLTLRRTPRTRATSGRLVVALSHLAGGDGLADHLGSALEQTDAGGTQIDLQPWQRDPRGLDHRLAHQVANQLGARARVIDPPSDLQHAATQFTDYDLVLGLRFHALIAAVIAGTPFVALAHEPKLAGLATRFGQLSVPPHSSAAVLAKALHLGRHQLPPDRAVARSEAARAAAGFRLLRLVITAGAAAEDGAPTTYVELSAGANSW